jgi:hypothetical protein
MNQPAARHELSLGQDTSRNRPVVRLVFSGGTCWIDHADFAAGTAGPTAPAAAPFVVAARLAASRTALAAPASRPHRRVLVITERFARGLDVIKCPPCCANAG